MREPAVQRSSARICADADVASGWTLYIDEVPQSYVRTDDPTVLPYKYMRWIAAAVGSLAPGARVLHLGGGAGSLARYWSAKSPGTSHLVYEVNEQVVQLVEAQLPFRVSDDITVVCASAEQALEAAAGTDLFDLVVVDVFADRVVPGCFAAVETLALVRSTLRADGVAVMNTSGGRRFLHTRRLVAGWLSTFPHVAIIGEAAALEGESLDNLVIVGAVGELDVKAIVETLDPQEAIVFEHSTAELLLDGAAPFDRWTAEPSPRGADL